MSIQAICTQCEVSCNAFKSYFYKYHRDLLLARHGVDAASVHTPNSKLRGKRGQTYSAYNKYKDAIAACDSVEYIDCNVSQIARIFKLNPTCLGNQLKAHYPEIIERRERERNVRGVADNRQRGARSWCKEQYAEAVELLRTTDFTLSEVAEKCGVSFTGLRYHIWLYHKDLVETRSDLRARARSDKREGHITGSGRRHEPNSGTRERYSKAVRLYRDTPMTVNEISRKLKLNLCSLSTYLKTWHRKEAFARRGAEYREDADISDTKQYKRSTAAKYAGAIAKLRQSGLPTATVAAEFGLNPECFRQYLKEHEPELYTIHGMEKTEAGRAILRRSMKKYGEALRLYETTDESLRSIADRLGLRYNSLSSFVHRNFPELIKSRKMREI